MICFRNIIIRRFSYKFLCFRLNILFMSNNRILRGILLFFFKLMFVYNCLVFFFKLCFCFGLVKILCIFFDKLFGIVLIVWDIWRIGVIRVLIFLVNCFFLRVYVLGIRKLFIILNMFKCWLRIFVDRRVCRYVFKVFRFFFRNFLFKLWNVRFLGRRRCGIDLNFFLRCRCKLLKLLYRLKIV